MYSLAVTYPHIFEASRGDAGLIPGVQCRNRRDYFYDAVVAKLVQIPGLVFDNIGQNSRINALVRGVKAAVDRGATSLTAVGASTRYAAHLADH
jgi:hypothetical protein